MGKWAQYSKRGTAKQQGYLAPFAVGDFTLGVLTATTIPVNRVAAFPLGADRWGVMVIKVSDNTVVWNTQGAATPITATGLTTGTQYRVYAAWFNSPALNRVSDWSSPLAATTP